MNYLSIPHYRGLKEKYSESLHGDGLYFTTDTHEIIANNASHGDNIASWNLHDGVLTLTMKSGAQQIVNFTEASETEKGLLSAADKQQLNNLQDNLDSKVDKVTGKSLILDSEIQKLAGLPNSTELTNSIATAKAAGDNAQSDLDAHKLNVSNPHQVTKAQLGLGNVTNDAQVKRSEMGVAGGVATLDGTGKVPAAQLPAYVDDVLEGTLINATTFQLAEGQQGGVQLPNVIYVDTTTNKSYRWSGTRYVTIASDLALGETSSTAYPGDKGKAATDNINKVKSTALSHIDDTTPVTYSASKVTVNYECYEGDQYGSTGTKHGADIAAASETAAGVMTAADKIQLNLTRQETLFHPIININQICPNQGQGDNKDRWLITYAIEAAWNWIKANSNRNIYLVPGLSIMFRSTNVRATNGFDGPWLVFTYTSTDFSENQFKKDSNWCRTLSEADLNYELADSQYDGFLSKIDWTRFNNATSTINSHVTNFQNPHNTNKSQVGLGNVDNTSDLDKPISTAQQTALDKKVDKTYVDEQLETKADKVDVDEQRISYVSPCFADCAETHEAKIKSITLAASVIPSKAIFSITLKIANNLTPLNQSPVYMHLVDISGNVIGVSQNAVKQVQNKGKYVTWFFDSAINTTGASFVIKLYTTNSASNANDSNFVDIIAHVSQDGGVEGIGVTSDDGTYHTDWTPAIGINVVNLAEIYPQIKELQKYRMAYATSELLDISTTGHEADINEIRISQTTMGISLVSSVSLMVASDNAYNGDLILLVLDINDNFVAVSNNIVNLSQNLGEYVTWYFTPFQLTDDAIYRFLAFDINSGDLQAMRIHVALDKNEGVTCLDQNNSPHTDYCPALGVNVSAIFAGDLYENIEDINDTIDRLSTKITNVETNLANVETNLANAFIGLEETLAYGVEWDTEVVDPHLTRIGNMSFHKTLPIQSQLKGCIAQKDKVIYWLNERDWRFKKDPETVSIGLTVDGGYSLVSDIFSTLRYEKQWVKIGGVACQINSINTDTNTATLVANDQLDALGLVTGTQDVELGAVLNGYDGTVRVYCPNFYIKSVIDGTKRRVWISTVKIDNSYTYQHEILIDAYRSTVLNTVPDKMGYLSTLPVNSAISVVNTHDYCRGGVGDRSEYDVYLETDPSRSDLCKPRTQTDRVHMRTYSRNAGSEMLSYDQYKNIFYWLYVIEYANFNCQEAYNEAVTAEGYKQGGLGDGVTTINSYLHWFYYNKQFPLTPCGYCNELGNGTGLKTMTVVTPTTSGGDPTQTYNFSVPRWRGFDNPFGDIWTNLDGIIIQGDAEGNQKTVYTTTDPNNYGDDESAKNAMEIAGHEIYQDGYTKEFDLGEAAHIIPESIGGDSTKYKCAYHYAGSKDTFLKTLFVGGRADSGAKAGLGRFDSSYRDFYASQPMGFRSVSAFVSFSE